MAICQAPSCHKLPAFLYFKLALFFGRRSSLTPVGYKIVYNVPKNPAPSPGTLFIQTPGVAEIWTYYLLAPRGQDGSTQNQTTPQNPRALTQDEINKVRRDITETLKNPGCAAFVAATLNQVASDTSLALFSDDVLKNFNEVVKTGTVEATLLSGREAQAWGSAGGGDARIQFNTQYPLTSTFPHVVGIRGIHETTHVSTNKRMYSYSDHDLALASYKVALKLGYKGVPKPPNTLDAIENGTYYADRLFNACRPVWQRTK